MPAHESIYEYYLHQHSKIDYCLDQCMSDAGSELVHELRICIKKLRAFHKLLEQLYLHEIVEHIRIKNRVRKLFKIAGQLRDIQVQIHLLAVFEEQTGINYPEFSTWLKKREKKRILRFGRKPQHVLPHATAHITHEKIGNWLAQASDETILTGAGEVLTGLCSKATELAAGTMNNRNLHRIRTYTKQVRYILNIMKHSYPDFSFNAISLDSIREIEAAAGYWHDNLVRIEWLGRFMEKLHGNDKSGLFKYQKLVNACQAELDIAYSTACRVVRNELLSDDQRLAIQDLD